MDIERSIRRICYNICPASFRKKSSMGRLGKTLHDQVNHSEVVDIVVGNTSYVYVCVVKRFALLKCLITPESF